MTLRSIICIDLEGALAAAQATLERAGEMGLTVSVSVTDATSRELVFLTHPDAPRPSAAIAREKALSAAGFRRDTANWAGRVGDKPLAQHTLSKFDGVAMIAGGVLIEVDGVAIGAIGVSGATSEEDHECAGAGVEAVRDMVAGDAED